MSGNSYGATASQAPLSTRRPSCETKWLLAPPVPARNQRPLYATPAVARDLLTEEKLQAALRDLKRGTAIDALRWSYEVLGLPHASAARQETPV